MSDIRHSLLRRDALSAAKEVLYHLDIYFSSQLQSAPLPIVDKGPVELLEEFVFQVPKERSAQPKVRPETVGFPGPAGRRAGLFPSDAGLCQAAGAPCPGAPRSRSASLLQQPPNPSPGPAVLLSCLSSLRGV